MAGSDVRAEIEDLILELLSLGPSSFAALYGFLVRETRGERATVADVFAVATDLEAEGWIRALKQSSEGAFAVVPGSEIGRSKQAYQDWLEAPDADLAVDALSYDEIGLWFELLPAGHLELQRRNGHQAPASAWMLDFDSSDQTITVLARDEPTAQRAIDDWLRVNLTFTVVKAENSTPAISFQLRDGTNVAGGVRLRVRVEEKRKP